MTNTILISPPQKIMTMTLNRPEKCNAINNEMIETMLEQLRELALNPILRVLILNGNGTHFCTGADIIWMHHIANQTSLKNEEDARLLAEMLYQLYTFPMPTIAIAHGKTMGGGLGFLAASDTVIAASDATFCLSEVKIGLTPATISPYMIACMGERLARYYMLTGETFNAETAKQMGLVHVIVDKDRLLEEAQNKANQLLNNGKEAMQQVKLLIQTVAKEKITDSLIKQTALALAKIRSSNEAQEGIKAFLEKRPPKWK